MKRKTSYPYPWARQTVNELLGTHPRGGEIAAWFFRKKFPEFEDLLIKSLMTDQLWWRFFRKSIHYLDECPKGTSRTSIFCDLKVILLNGCGGVFNEVEQESILQTFAWMVFS